MMTVNEVSKIMGVSIRALHHYDNIVLLPATEVTDAGYHLYDDTALERLQYILLFKELKKEHLQNLMDLACGIKAIGVKNIREDNPTKIIFLFFFHFCEIEE